jgi:nucleoside-diphosphate-sugar epimerase
MILVTGGTGLVGSHLLFELTNAGKNVRAIKRSDKNIDNVFRTFRFYVKDPQPLLNRIEWIEADLLNYESLLIALKDIEIVYNCAGFISFSEKDKKQLLDVNINGTANLVNACLDTKPKKLVHLSSIAALGIPENELETINELSIWDHNAPHSSYSFSKYKGEMEVWRGIAEGLNAVILNPSVILGPGDWNNGFSGFFKTIWCGMKYYTEGVTGFVDVHDVCEAMINLAGSEISSEKFVLSAENLSYKQIFTLIAESLGKKPPHIKSSKLMLNISWRTDYLISTLLFRKPRITKNAAKTALVKQYYSSRKLADAINIDFIPIKESINNIAANFLKDYLK